MIKRKLTKKITKPKRNPTKGLYPFLWSTDFEKPLPIPIELKPNRYYVIIGVFGYNYLEDPYQMIDDNWVLTPTLNVIKETHEFNTEHGALEFIKKWWSKQ